MNGNPSGLIGRDILASRSPWLHEQEARALGMALTYELFDFRVLGLAEDALGPFLRRLCEQGYCGVNVTHPYKQAVMPFLDGVDEVAGLVGAAQAVEFDERLKTPMMKNCPAINKAMTIVTDSR